MFCLMSYGYKNLFALFRLLFLGLVCGTLMPCIAIASPKVAYLINLHGAIDSNLVRYVDRGFSKAADQDARIVILEIHTHGGETASVIKIVHAILHSPVPVAGLVYPEGTHLGLLGLLILFACPVASMAPSTYLDTQLHRPGKSYRGGVEMTPQQLTSSASILHELAKRNGRYDPWEGAALQREAFLSAINAEQLHVIDFVVTSPQALLFALDGRRIHGLRGWQVLHSSNLVLEQDYPGWQRRVLTLMANPNLIYLLLIIGIFGILFELASPGLILPGAIGTVSLIFALYALQGVLIDYSGLGLMLGGVGLMVLASYMNRFRLLGVGGVAAFTIGSLLLFDIRGIQVSRVMVGGLAIVSAVLFLGLSRRLISLRRRGAISGREALIGSHGLVVSDFVGHGQIHLNGELWQATSKLPLQRGQLVRVVGIKGLTLEVIPEEK